MNVYIAATLTLLTGSELSPHSPWTEQNYKENRRVSP